MAELHVGLGKSSYTILIENGLRHRLPQEIKKIYSGKKVPSSRITTSMRITEHSWRKGFRLPVTRRLWLSCQVGEQTNFQMLPQIYDQLLDFQLNQIELIIALGGGVIGGVLRGLQLQTSCAVSHSSRFRLPYWLKWTAASEARSA